MTDELDPRPEADPSGPQPDIPAATPAPDAATTRVATPSAPLTPADRSLPGTTIHEDDVTWATPEPVMPAAVPARRGGRLRWAAAIAVVAVVLAATVAVAALVTGSSAASVVVGYVPADTTMYGEVRLDLPGDQRQALGSFLQKFPGFADQASLDSKIDEVLDDLIRGATDGDQTYTTDIKPWFGGEIAYSVGALPPMSALDGANSMGSARATVIASVTDGPLAETWITAAIDKAGATTTVETYQGSTIHVFDKVDGVSFGYALVGGKVVVFGDVASVKAAIDSNGNSGFASEPGPKAAFASVEGDYVGFSYVALRPLLDWSTGSPDAAGSGAGTATTAAMTDTLRKLVPDWMAYWVRFESDALVVQGSAPKPELAIGPTQNHASAAIDHVPGDAVFALTSNDVGATVQAALDAYKSDPNIGPMLDGLDQALGLVGGADSALGWIGDVAVAIEVVDGEPAGGLIIVPTDEAASKQLLTTLKTFIALGGGQAGVSTSDESYQGATITTVDLSGVAGLAGGAGLPIDAGTIQISFTEADGVVVVGSGPDFVKSVLDTTDTTSLGHDQTWSQLSSEAGPSTSTMYLDIDAVRGLIESAMTDAGQSVGKDYETDIKPFLTPFESLFAAGSVDGDLTRSDLIVTVH
jgi:Protein of unknown function (DUF3352)